MLMKKIMGGTQQLICPHLRIVDRDDALLLDEGERKKHKQPSESVIIKLPVWMLFPIELLNTLLRPDSTGLGGRVKSEF